MSANFQLEFRKSNGNLHLQARGDFDGSAACQLINLLDEQYNDKGRIFIDTQNLCKICPFGCSAFQSKLKISRVPADRLFLKGEKGFEIAPKGSKVIVVDKERRCRCKGNCANCPRPGKKKLN
ncbi:MAG: peptidylprolyl isomerase [Desulfobacterales bacterium]|nr:peptidylprolyl isomerase [Desulfobacterales bacterium]